jgi:hypothetical protein
MNTATWCCLMSSAEKLPENTCDNEFRPKLPATTQGFDIMLNQV